MSTELQALTHLRQQELPSPIQVSLQGGKFLTSRGKRALEGFTAYACQATTIKEVSLAQKVIKLSFEGTPPVSVFEIDNLPVILQNIEDKAG
ncbi:hypothetical protein L914_00404 [Phytophthora nicotianae]|uniref:Uncharacterized protein n=1 Tax=Phytophthora nicotianae TaxID=4792 RepID=W2P7J0_PHYNI|nr:hypothetical protein L914_00404 [Phytophthora nicotianae]